MAEIDYNRAGSHTRDAAHATLETLMHQSRPPVGQLSPQSWMTDGRTQAVIAALTAGGAEVRFVGGCVRDALLHRPIKDIDLATQEPPEMVVKRLECAGLKAVPTGIAHGTVTAVSDGLSIEITTLRRDVATDGRHAEVAFSTDFREDAARRDFTMNALSATPDGAVYDYFDGLSDLAARVVRFVGRPQERIREDYLRILRFFRFHAHYGEGEPLAEALSACRANAKGLDQLSGERIRDELLKTLAAPAPANVLVTMRGESVLDHVLPEAAHFDTLRVLAWLETAGLRRDDISPDPLRRLAALLAVDRDGARMVADRLRLSTVDRDRLADLTAPTPASPEPDPAAAPHEMRVQAYHLGPARLRDRTLILWARERASVGRLDSARSAAWLRLLDTALGWTPPPAPVRGRDVLALGVAPGPQVGDLVRAAEKAWIDSDFQADRETLLQSLRARL
jgi:poly(A) polymerase